MKQQRNTNEAAGAAPSEDAVHLRPLAGIRPGVYLAALYGTIILIMLFFVLLFPGLRHPGSVLVVTSEPQGAAIRIDDLYHAVAPARIFVPKGRHTITAAMPGFEPASADIDAPSRVFASLFIPQTVPLALTLQQTTPYAALAAGAAEYAAWSFAGEPTIDYQIPLSLSEGVYRSAANLAGAHDTLKAATRFMVTQAATKDLLRAEFLAAAGGLAPSPLTLLEAARDVFDYITTNRLFVVAIADVHPGEAARALIDSSLYPEVWIPAGYQSPVFSAPRTGGPFSIEGIPFSARLPPNKYTQAANFQHEKAVGPFLISLREISYEQWQHFLAENPRWRLEERQTLIEAGMVSEDYLEPFASYRNHADFYTEYPAYPQPAMSGISWYAAQAFCEWLTTKLPASLRQYAARLPTEAEWEYAARFAEASPSDTALPQGMARQGTGQTGLWEWCADFFAPLNYLDAPADAIAALSSPERSVRGGTWTNVQEPVPIQRRASLPPESCSAFVGFRVVIAPVVPEQTERLP